MAEEPPLEAANEPEEEQQAAEAQQHEEAEQQETEEQERQEEEDEPRDPGSSMVSSWGYNRESEELEVEFVNGRSESYPCSPAQWEEARESSSAGKWMHANVL